MCNPAQNDRSKLTSWPSRTKNKGVNNWHAWSSQSIIYILLICTIRDQSKSATIVLLFKMIGRSLHYDPAGLKIRVLTIDMHDRHQKLYILLVCSVRDQSKSATIYITVVQDDRSKLTSWPSRTKNKGVNNRHAWSLQIIIYSINRQHQGSIKVCYSTFICWHMVAYTLLHTFECNNVNMFGL